MSSQATKAVGRHCSNHNPSTLPANIPAGYIGEVVLPGTGRVVWWTGRVSIGLRYQPRQHFEPVAHSAHWIQELMLGKSQQRLTSFILHSKHKNIIKVLLPCSDNC